MGVQKFLNRSKIKSQTCSFCDFETFSEKKYCSSACFGEFLAMETGQTEVVKNDVNDEIEMYFKYVTMHCN